jgi:hypothetical protein
MTKYENGSLYMSGKKSNVFASGQPVIESRDHSNETFEEMHNNQLLKDSNSCQLFSKLFAKV